MKLVHLETFLWLARLRNFSRTAETMNTTQPAISARIAALEQELGVKLVDRSTRELHLTPQGEELLQSCERILSEVEDLRQRIVGRTSLRGTVRIGAIDAIVQSWLPRLVERLHAEHPNVVVEVIVDTTANLSSALRHDALQIAICMEPVVEDGFSNFVVCNYAMAWVASPRRFDVERTFEVSELGRLPIISFPPSSPPFRMIAPYFQDESVLASQLSISNSLPTMVRLAVDGIGVAAVPPVVIPRELAAGELAILKVRKPFPPLSFICSYRSSPRAAMLDRVVEMTRRAATDFCALSDPALAWR